MEFLLDFRAFLVGLTAMALCLIPVAVFAGWWPVLCGSAPGAGL
jgi:hypothetical protein